MDVSGLNYLDYAVIAIVVISTLFAFIRGFIGSFLSLVGWVVSIYLAYVCFPMVEPYIAAKVKSPIVVIIIGHALILIACLIAFGIFNIVATTAVKGLTSGIFDRTLGAAFGLFRGGIIVSFIFFVVYTSVTIFSGNNQDQQAEDTLPKWLTGAKSYGMLKEGSNILASFIPDSFYDRFKQMSEEITKKTLDDRFMDTAIAKMRKALTPKDLATIEEKAKEESLVQSNEEARISKAEDIMKAYQKRSSSLDNKDKLSKEEMNRLTDIINAKKVELKDTTAKFEAEGEAE